MIFPGEIGNIIQRFKSVDIFLLRPGFNAHAAAEAAVLFAQGRAPANLSPGELAHYQAEQAVLAAQQNLLVQG